ncbi:Lipase 2 [Golovinomyces cichoracearum]|uniref:Carboxylic ester hydrolase n=1 Tax=Golovinomyces cichoracearum TaxID=62708 RepID=A0A420IQW8_9PEZI|nr:Lipase 2 [Golovinomyces cichoracearum]
MFYSSWVILLYVIISVFGEPIPVVSKNIVDLGYARYQGVEIAAGVKYWLGVRFAAAPVGNLRWRAPVDPAVDNSLQDASQFKPICIGTLKFGDATQDEDCLFLNIFAPANATSESRLPVWFFTPGGGYSLNSDANYNATELIKQSGGNIILVQTSYRVSAFGFLASEKIREDGELNVGFLDQRKSLEWVQKHISKFGGDPNRVVIHGDSAGAGSVALHLVAYGGRDDGLFKSAILESVFFPTQRKVVDYEFQYDNFVSLSNCSTSNDTLNCLRNAPVSVLKAANSQPIPFPNATTPAFFPYAPCVDGNIIPDYPTRLFIEGKFIKVPIMIGGDTDEGNGFVNDASTSNEMVEYMHNQFPKLSDENLKRMNESYPLMSPLPLHKPYFPSVALAYGEAIFTCPGLLISSAFYNHSSVNIFHYHYNVQDQNLISLGKGVPHVFELSALFNTFDPNTSSYSTYNKAIVPEVRGYWINFVMRDNPNPPFDKVTDDRNHVNWTTWGSESDTLMKEQRLLIQTNVTHMENVPEEQKARCQFWRSVIDETEV